MGRRCINGFRVRRWALGGAAFVSLSAVGLEAASYGAESGATYDVVIRNGVIYDGSGKPAYPGVVAIDKDRIVYVGPAKPLRGRTEIDASGKAVAPGFINMLSHAEESLLVDGRAVSDLVQGVTLEVMGETSMGPLSPQMRQLQEARQTDLKYPIDWNTFGQYMETLERKGVSPNVAAFVAHPSVRTYVLGEGDVQPTPEQLASMQGLVRSAMEEGAVGLTTALIYAPATYAKTPELIALARESARCGGVYSVHMRSEGDQIDAAVDETFAIGQASQGPVHIYHLKLAGKDNWSKRDGLLARVNVVRGQGLRVTADMYPYTVAGTGLDAAMPPWVQAGGYEAWRARLKDPAIRARVAAEMRQAHPPGWENYMVQAGGPQGMRFLAFANPALKPLAGKTLAEVAAQRGASPEDTVMDLVVEDGSRVEVAYTLMSDANVATQLAQPWIAINSDSAAPAPEGVFLQQQPHPRTYGAFARLFAKYVREEKVMSVAEAVRRVTSLPADTLFLTDRGRLRAGAYADVVVFDPQAFTDHATFEKPHQLATGVSDVIVNGQLALRDGKPTGAKSGRFVRGRGWSGAPGGGCKASGVDWPSKP